MTPPNTSPITMLQVAKHLGLSQATVSRVLNGKGHEFISPATRRRVLEAAKSLGFDPGRLRAAESSSLHQVVAVWIRNVDMSYYGSIIHHLQRIAVADDFAVVVSGYRDLSSEAPFDPDRLPGWNTAKWPVDGIIAVDCPQRQHTFIESRRGDAPPPIVGIGCDADPRIDNVVYEMHNASYEAVKQLVASGRRSVAHVSAYYSLPRVREARAAGYARAMEEAGLPTWTMVASEETAASAKSLVLEQLRGSVKRPDAIFCMHDYLAIGVYQALKELGLAQDVAVLGYGDVPELELLDGAISTIRLPVEELAEKAWQVFKERLASPEAAQQRIVIHPRVIMRPEALALPRAGRAVVAAARN